MKAEKLCCAMVAVSAAALSALRVDAGPMLGGVARPVRCNALLRDVRMAVLSIVLYMYYFKPKSTNRCQLLT